MKYERVQKTSSLNFLSSINSKWRKYCAGEESDMQSLLSSLFHCKLLHYRTLDGCENLAQLTHSAYDAYEEVPGNMSILRDGYSALINTLAKNLHSKQLRLNCTVKKIEWNRIENNEIGSSVVVSFVQGHELKTIEADHVIITIPLGCLKACHHTIFHPPFPPTKIDALRRLVFIS